MTFALRAAVGPVPASHTADAPVLIPAPIAACVEGVVRGSPSSSAQTHASRCLLEASSPSQVGSISGGLWRRRWCPPRVSSGRPRTGPDANTATLPRSTQATLRVLDEQEPRPHRFERLFGVQVEIPV